MSGNADALQPSSVGKPEPTEALGNARDDEGMLRR